MPPISLYTDDRSIVVALRQVVRCGSWRNACMPKLRIENRSRSPIGELSLAPNTTHTHTREICVMVFDCSYHISFNTDAGAWCHMYTLSWEHQRWWWLIVFNRGKLYTCEQSYPAVNQSILKYTIACEAECQPNWHCSLESSNGFSQCFLMCAHAGLLLDG